MAKIFVTLSASQLVPVLEQDFGFRFDNQTFLFLDEIQSCSAAIAALHYFQEENPQLPVIPESVKCFVNEPKVTDGVTQAARCHNEIAQSYRSDFSKYRNRLPLESLQCVWDALPTSSHEDHSIFKLLPNISRF